MLQVRHQVVFQTLILLFVIVCYSNVASSEGRLVCYYTNWSVYRPGNAKFSPQNINPYLCTHLIYAFGGFTKDNQIKPFDKYQDVEQGGFAKFNGLKTYNNHLKTMIAIGGWNEASSRFSPLMASIERRQKFIKNILKFLRQNHFDGIDLDWEYPAQREGGKSRDRDNYAQFVQELRIELDREAENTGRSRLLLSMAVPAGIEYIESGYDVPKLNTYLDWFNVLAYDFHSSHEPSVNHHAPLYSFGNDSEYNYNTELNIDFSIKYYLKAGANRNKLVLGIPAYGRSYTLINENSTELGAPSEGPGNQGDATREKGYLAYYEICQFLKGDPEWTVVQHNVSVMGPYAYRGNQWVGYDDEAIVRKKAEYVVAQGLGGIMFWAIDNDDFRGNCNGKPYPLIEAAKKAMEEAFGLKTEKVIGLSGPQNLLSLGNPDNKSTINQISLEPEVNKICMDAPRQSIETSLSPSDTNLKLSEIWNGRISSTPLPPTTNDRGSVFKCEEEGFFQHPRDCKKYYWCVDNESSGLGIVAHQFTCPSGLFFNPAADSCDFARNVPCKPNKSAVSNPTSITHVGLAIVGRPAKTRTPTTTTSNTLAQVPKGEFITNESDKNREKLPNNSSDTEEDPQVIKDLIDLIRKAGGIEQLEKYFLQNKAGSVTFKKNSATKLSTTPPSFSKTLYERLLNRPRTFNTYSRNHLFAEHVQIAETTESKNVEESDNNSFQNVSSKLTSALRGKSRQSPQNEDIDKDTHHDGSLMERKLYVTIHRNRSDPYPDQTIVFKENQTDRRDQYEPLHMKQIDTTSHTLTVVSPSYTSLSRSEKNKPLYTEYDEATKQSNRAKQYAILNRTRGGTTTSFNITVPQESGLVSWTTERTKNFEMMNISSMNKDHLLYANSIEDINKSNEENKEYSLQGNVSLQKNNGITKTLKSAYNIDNISRRATITKIKKITSSANDTITSTMAAKSITGIDTDNTSTKNSTNNPKTIINLKNKPESVNTQSETITVTNKNTQPNETTAIQHTASNAYFRSTRLQIPKPTLVSIFQEKPKIVDTLNPADSVDPMLQLNTLVTTNKSNYASNAFNVPLVNISVYNSTQVAFSSATKTTPTYLIHSSQNTKQIRDQNNVNMEAGNNKKYNSINIDRKVIFQTENKYASSLQPINPNSNKIKINSSSSFDKSNRLRDNSASLNGERSTYNDKKLMPKIQHTELEMIDASKAPVNRNKSKTVTNIRKRIDNNYKLTYADDKAKIAKTEISQVDRPKNHYLYGRPRDSATASITPTTSMPTEVTTTMRYLSLESCSREQVTKLPIVHNQSVKYKKDIDINEDVTPTKTTNAKPLRKRIYVVKYRRPLSFKYNDNKSVTTTTNIKNIHYGNLRRRNPLRKIVYKLRLFETKKEPVALGKTVTTTSELFQPKTNRLKATIINDKDNNINDYKRESTAVHIQQRPFGLQVYDDLIDGGITKKEKVVNLISSGKGDKYTSPVQNRQNEQSAKESQQDIINFQLDKLLINVSTFSIPEYSNKVLNYSTSSPRPSLQRKLVVKRPLYSLPADLPAKPTLVFGSARSIQNLLCINYEQSDSLSPNIKKKAEDFMRGNPRQSELKNFNQSKLENREKDINNYYHEEQKKHTQVHLKGRSPTTLEMRRQDMEIPQQVQEIEQYGVGKKYNENKKETNYISIKLKVPDSTQVQLNTDTTETKLYSQLDYRKRKNRVISGTRANFTRSRQTKNRISDKSIITLPYTFVSSYQPRIINRQLAVAMIHLKPKLTMRPLVNIHEQTVLPTKSLIENLGIDASNLINKEIFNIKIKNNTMFKPKKAINSDIEPRPQLIDDHQQESQVYVTTTPSTPTLPVKITLETYTKHTETDNATAQPEIVLSAYSNKDTNISSLLQDKTPPSSPLKIPSPPSSMTLLHVFALVKGVSDQTLLNPPLERRITAMEAKHKLIEINRIVEINSKQSINTQRKSKANQGFSVLRIESFPHIEQLGEISVVKRVHEVGSSNIQIDNGHSAVADYKDNRDNNRDGKSFLPYISSGAIETSTISLEGLFDSPRMSKLHSMT